MYFNQLKVDYMPNDSSGEPSPFASWRVGRNLIKPQLEWTKDCMLYFHESVQTNASCSDIIVRFLNLIHILYNINIVLDCVSNIFFFFRFMLDWLVSCWLIVWRNLMKSSKCDL